MIGMIVADHPGALTFAHHAATLVDNYVFFDPKSAPLLEESSEEDASPSGQLSPPRSYWDYLPSIRIKDQSEERDGDSAESA